MYPTMMDLDAKMETNDDDDDDREDSTEKETNDEGDSKGLSGTGYEGDQSDSKDSNDQKDGKETGVEIDPSKPPHAHPISSDSGAGDSGRREEYSGGITGGDDPRGMLFRS
ncbi:hypothetical protein L6452_14612 [Arctium lappa]|uniref:Uncharacterized protein n=1 Tax=Arctium lappa TaxID=4217 RepID=A0ACB9CLI3_ARCLA|nr:hypothetical protein L6452_14612 [Arctium lappa]